jgi:phosphate acetyltransferase
VTEPFLDRLHARAAAKCPALVFAEGDDDRTLSAMRIVLDRGIARPFAVVSSRERASAVAASGVVPLLPDAHDWTAIARARVRAWQTRRGEAVSSGALPPLAFANALVAEGLVAGCVAGAVHPTADVLRWALRLIGPADGIESVSSAFYMVAPNSVAWPHEVLTFTDCGVIPSPSAEQLSGIAIAAAADRRRIVGDTPRIAFLSFSTHGSAASASVDRVRAAAALTRARLPDVEVDGELQGDAALVTDVRQRKAPESPFTGPANVLVFPDLDSGNIAYKLVQRLTGAVAIGPILQGFAHPTHDLSRGATVEEIVHVAAIAAVQAA